jgi:hypothetical protein
MLCIQMVLDSNLNSETNYCDLDLEVCDDGTSLQLFTFWTLSIVQSFY